MFLLWADLNRETHIDRSCDDFPINSDKEIFYMAENFCSFVSGYGQLIEMARIQNVDFTTTF